MPELFDMKLRALRRDRAARQGPEVFLLERAFDDCIDRIAFMQPRFGSALLIGCPDPNWPERLGVFAGHIDVADPGQVFATAAGGKQIVEDSWAPAQAAYDLVMTIGSLDTVNDLPRALLALRRSMTAGGLFIGAMSGGDTVPQLRAAMRAADTASGGATPRVHPRIEASALAPLLASVGFVNPVVDVDRVAASYRSLAALVRDLRRMAATNILLQRSRQAVSRAAYLAAAEVFAAAGDGERTSETFEILHFACWTPAV